MICDFSIREFTRFEVLSILQGLWARINIRKEVAFGCVSCGLFEKVVLENNPRLNSQFGAALSLMGKRFYWLIWIRKTI